MLRKLVNYTDFNGVKRSETFAFNLTRAELTRLENEVPGGFGTFIEGISKAGNAPAVYKQIEKIIEYAYGVPSDDGRVMDKDRRHFRLFRSSEAYSELIFTLIDKPGQLADFINGIMPEKWMKEVEELTEKYGSVDKALEVIKSETRELR